MGKSQQTFNKKEREKKRAKKKKEKLERREQRKVEKTERGKTEPTFMYMDENGNLVAEKPDPAKKFQINVEDIKLGVPQNSKEAFDPIRRGKVKFFSNDKGYGFITEKATKDSVFVHANDAYDDIRENHIVEFEIGSGPKGPKAINVKQVKN